MRAAALLVVLVGCAPPEEPRARAEATTEECDAPRDPAQVLAGRSGSTCLVIDRLEVTQRAYRDFLALAAQPVVPGCDWNEDLRPDDACLARPEVAEADDRPAVCLDICDAASFCVAAGKHLCAGDPTGTEARDQSDWVRACTNDGQTTQFPYPGDGVDGRCNVDSTSATPPGAYATCTSMSGAMDLSGNVAEWTLPCEGAGPDAICPARGGSFLDTEIASARCASQVFLPANARSSYVGFRCCGDNL